MTSPSDQREEGGERYSWWGLLFAPREFRVPSLCCGALKYGWHTPFGWVIRCSRCHAELC